MTRSPFIVKYDNPSYESRSGNYAKNPRHARVPRVPLAGMHITRTVSQSFPIVALARSFARLAARARFRSRSAIEQWILQKLRQIALMATAGRVRGPWQTLFDGMNRSR